jgi:hypothetical protein
MSMKNNRRILVPVFLTVLLGVVAVSFQNCAPAEEAGSASALSEAAIFSSNGKMWLTTGQSSLAKDSLFTVEANLGNYPEGTKFIWDHVLNSGLTYCEQTTNSRKNRTSFVCPEEGRIRVHLIAIMADDSEELSELELAVGSSAPPPSSTPRPGSSPTPTPTPAGFNAAMYYAANCVGCHGAAPGEHGAKNVARLNTAINNNTGGMGGFSGLPMADRQTLMNYLNSL